MPSTKSVFSPLTISVVSCLWISMASAMSTPTPPCRYNFTGPSDIVFIMDRSGSLRSGQLSTHFDQMKKFVSDLIKNFLIIRQDQNRIAVVSYGADVTEDINFISESSEISECELFASGGRWETDVIFDALRANAPREGQLFEDAFVKAKEILSHSDRRSQGIKQNIWVLSDLEEQTVLPTPLDATLIYDIYGLGIGHQLHMENFIRFVPERCNALNHSEWVDVITDLTSNRDNFGMKTQVELVPLVETQLCPDSCDGGCSCLEFTRYTSNALFQCNGLPRESTEESSRENKNMGMLDGDTLWWIIIGAASGVILISVIIIICACVVRRRRRRKERNQNKTLPRLGFPETPTTFTVEVPPPTTLSPNSPDVIPSDPHYRDPANDDNVYNNDDLEEALRAHGLVTRISDKDKEVVDSNQPSQNTHYKKKEENSEPPIIPRRFTPNQDKINTQENGHIRHISNVSNSSIPPYIAPIPGTPIGGGSRVGSNGYSYPYMEIPLSHANTIGGNGVRNFESNGHHYYDGHIRSENEASTNRYEQCTFPLAKKEERAKNKAAKDKKSNDENVTEDIVKQKQKLKPVPKFFSFKKSDAKAERSPAPTKKDKSRKKSKVPAITITNISEDYVNIDQESEKSAKEEESEKRTSMKFGTGKFNAIKAQLERLESGHSEPNANMPFSKVL